jgi:hypothetical protein
MAIELLFKEMSGRCTSVIDSTHCIYETIIAQELMMSTILITKEVLESLDGDIKIYVDLS